MVIKRDKILNLALVILIILFIACVLALIYLNTNFQNKNLDITKQQIIEGCSNLSLEKTANCLNSEIRVFFNYNLTNNPENFEELKENGGVCRHYANLYLELAEKLGFNTKYVVFAFTSDSLHGMALISNHEGYCILDQKSRARCDLRFEVDKEEGEMTKQIEDYINAF